MFLVFAETSATTNLRLISAYALYLDLRLRVSSVVIKLEDSVGLKSRFRLTHLAVKNFEVALIRYEVHVEYEPGRMHVIA